MSTHLFQICAGLRCSYITVVFASAASQKGFSTYSPTSFVFIRKPILLEKDKNIDFESLFYNRTVVEKGYLLCGTFVELCKRRFVMQPFQNPP
jgi:hypothetical protein